MYKLIKSLGFMAVLLGISLVSCEAVSYTHLTLPTIA